MIEMEKGIFIFFFFRSFLTFSHFAQSLLSYLLLRSWTKQSLLSSLLSAVRWLLQINTFIWYCIFCVCYCISIRGSITGIINRTLLLIIFSSWDVFDTSSSIFPLWNHTKTALDLFVRWKKLKENWKFVLHCYASWGCANSVSDWQTFYEIKFNNRELNGLHQVIKRELRTENMLGRQASDEKL